MIRKNFSECFLKMDFDRIVYAIVKRVKPGTVTTYGKIAIAMGMPKHSRHVGRVLSNNPYAPQVPCHRVIKADGQLGGFFGSNGASVKAKLLESEGVVIVNGKVQKKFIVDAEYVQNSELETSEVYLKS